MCCNHTNDPTVLLKEAKRVAQSRRAKGSYDGRNTGISDVAVHKLGWQRLAWVALPYNYRPESRWRLTFDAIGLRIAQWQPQLGLYPFPASLIFERDLHFVAALGIE
jgi:hypothetical protein